MSKENTLLVNFVTDSSVSNEGFHAAYRSVFGGCLVGGSLVAVSLVLCGSLMGHWLVFDGTLVGLLWDIGGSLMIGWSLMGHW